MVTLSGGFFILFVGVETLVPKVARPWGWPQKIAFKSGATMAKWTVRSPLWAFVGVISQVIFYFQKIKLMFFFFLNTIVKLEDFRKLTTSPITLWVIPNKRIVMLIPIPKRVRILYMHSSTFWLFSKFEFYLDEDF